MIQSPFGSIAYRDMSRLTDKTIEGVFILPHMEIRPKEKRVNAFFLGPEDASIHTAGFLRTLKSEHAEDERLFILAVHTFELGHYIRASSLFEQFLPSSPLYSVAKLGAALSYLTQAKDVCRMRQSSNPEDRQNNGTLRNLEESEWRIRRLIQIKKEGADHE